MPTAHCQRRHAIDTGRYPKAWFLNKYPNYQDVDFADIATSQKPEEKASAPSELRKTA